MPRSVVDIAQLRALDAAIKAFAENTDASMAAYRRSALTLISQFESKLAELASIRNQKLEALNRCEYRRSLDNSVSCAMQASSFHAADSRYRQCEALVRQARNAVYEYENYVNSYCISRNDLCMRGSSGLSRVESIVNEYVNNATPVSTGMMSSGASVASASSASVGGQTSDDMARVDPATLIVGGDQIDHVIPMGSGTDPVMINTDINKLEGLPPVSAPDQAKVRFAAAGILTVLAAGGLVIGAREMLLQQKADEIFLDQYGISRTELLLASGPKQKEYVAAYNGICDGLRQEMKEIKKEELFNQIRKKKDFLSLEDRRINELHGEVTLYGRELVHDTKIEIENLENQIATLDDGKKRPIVPLGKTKIGGLSEDGLLFMKEGVETKERYIAVSNLLSNSKVVISGDNGKEYMFKNGEADIFFVSHDGSYVNRYMRDFSQGFSETKAEINLPGADFTGYPEKMSDGKFSLAGVGAEQKYTAEGVRVTNKHYSISKDGSIWTDIMDVGVGGEAKASASMDFSGAEVGVGFSVARAGAKNTYITAPVLKNGKYVQTEYGLSAEANLGLALAVGKSGAADGTTELGTKIPFGKMAVVYAKYDLSEKEFPESIRKQLK